MNTEQLKSVAREIVAPQKGVLAADESSPTIKKRFDSIKLESTEEHRRRYRELLFTTEGRWHSVRGTVDQPWRCARDQGRQGCQTACTIPGRACD
jgi:fructose-bisphosphate aldolase class I